MKRKSLLLAIILNIAVVGLGHVYLGLWKKGLAFFVMAIVLAIPSAGTLALFPMAVAVVDAVKCTKRINAGEPIDILRQEGIKADISPKTVSGLFKK